MSAVKLFVGTADGLHEVHGAGEPSRIHLAGQEVNALVPDPEGKAWWAVTDGESIWRWGHTGSWEQLAVVEGGRANCLLPFASGALVGMSEAHLKALREGKLDPVGSFDRAPGRDQWYTPWGGPPDVRSMDGSNGALYVNVHVGGIVRSLDAGATWEPTIDIDADVHQVIAPGERPGLVLAACADGLAVSLDGGDTWSFEAKGLHATYSRAVALAGDVVLVSASMGPRGAASSVYRRRLDPAEPFVRCTEGLPEDWFEDNINTFCLAASGSEVGFGTSDGSLYVSTDRGEFWRAVAAGLPPVRCLAFASG